MKKFLFTLATLVAAVFAANASAPQMNLNTNEITLGAGQQQEVTIQLTAGLDDIMRGAQLQFVMYNPAGERIADKVILVKKYSRNTQWFGALTISKANDEGNPGNAVGTSNPFPAKYRALMSNASCNEFWYPEAQYIEWEMDAHTYPLDVLAFTVKVDAEDWADEYAILRAECNPKAMEQEGEDEYPLKATMVNGSFVYEDGFMELKINNADYEAPGPQTEPLTGTITIGGEDNNYVVPITVNVNGTYDLVVTVAKDGGDPYEVTPDADGNITLGVAPEYGTYVINATATGNGDYEGTVEAEAKTINIDQPKLDDPDIDFQAGETGLTIIVDGATRYEVWVDGVNMGEINFVEKTWAEQEVVVKAWNEATGYIAGYAEDNTTVAAKDNMDLTGHVVFGAVDQETGKVHVTYTGEEEVTITVTCTEVREVLALDENNDVQLPHYGKFNLVGEAKATHYNTLTEEAVEREWLEPETTTTAPDINAGVNEETHTFDIVATGANADDAVTLYVTWYDGEGTAHNETVTGTGSASFSLPQTEDVQYVSYWASALNPADDNAGVNNGAQYVEVPAYVPTPENKDFQGTVTVSVDDQGNVTAVYNPAEGEDVTPTIVCDPNKLNEYGENIPVNVTVSAPGYNDRTYPETVNYPAPTLPQTAAPTFQQRAELGVVGQWITITETEPSTIYYRFAVDGEAYTEWMEYTGEIPFTTPGTYTIQAYAIAPNKSASTEITLEFVVSKYPTSIEELMSAKDVAGVHYYNLAGQQMKEINGFTIVVVSYTDGSSVAMKVMK